MTYHDAKILCLEDAADDEIKISNVYQGDFAKGIKTIKIIGKGNITYLIYQGVGILYYVFKVFIALRLQKNRTRFIIRIQKS